MIISRKRNDSGHLSRAGNPAFLRRVMGFDLDCRVASLLAMMKAGYFGDCAKKPDPAPKGRIWFYVTEGGRIPDAYTIKSTHIFRYTLLNCFRVFLCFSPFPHKK